MGPSVSSHYAGDVTPGQAWERLGSDPKAQLIDVRTMAEWAFVGLPDLAALPHASASPARPVHRIEWQRFPTGAPNPSFVDEARAALAAVGADESSPLLLLCRSGARSQAAAIALTQAGYRTCFNISQGFEGNKDAQGHRGNVGGWKAAGLPWRQD